MDLIQIEYDYCIMILIMFIKYKFMVFKSYDRYQLASNLSINYCRREVNEWIMFFMKTCSYYANFWCL